MTEDRQIALWIFKRITGHDELSKAVDSLCGDLGLNARAGPRKAALRRIVAIERLASESLAVLIHEARNAIDDGDTKEAQTRLRAAEILGRMVMDERDRIWAERNAPVRC